MGYIGIGAAALGTRTASVYRAPVARVAMRAPVRRVAVRAPVKRVVVRAPVSSKTQWGVSAPVIGRTPVRPPAWGRRTAPPAWGRKPPPLASTVLPNTTLASGASVAGGTLGQAVALPSNTLMPSSPAMVSSGNGGWSGGDWGGGGSFMTPEEASQEASMETEADGAAPDPGTTAPVKKSGGGLPLVVGLGILAKILFF